MKVEKNGKNPINIALGKATQLQDNVDSDYAKFEEYMHDIDSTTSAELEVSAMKHYFSLILKPFMY